MRIGARRRSGPGWKRIAGAGRAVLALGGLAAYGVFAVPRVAPACGEAIVRTRDAFWHGGESADEALEEVRGKIYMDALKKIRQTIPPDAAYYLVPIEGEGAAFPVRFDLAPRRPILLQEVRPGSLPLPGAPRWVVLARVFGAGPEIVETREYFRRESGS
ncbi:MAG: hypothetical protein ACHQPI_05660 [Thermoanaerobaculia bacterium]